MRKIRVTTFSILHSKFEILNSNLQKRKLSGDRIDDHGFPRLVPGRDDGDRRLSGGHDQLFVEMAEDDVREAFAMPVGGVSLHLRQWQLALVLEVRPREPLLDAVDEVARGALRNQL